MLKSKLNIQIISVFARTYIPNDVDIEYEIDLSNEDLIGLELSFDDNVSRDNYYRLKLYLSRSKEWENEEGELEIYYWDGFVWRCYQLILHRIRIPSDILSLKSSCFQMRR